MVCRRWSDESIARARVGFHMVLVRFCMIQFDGPLYPSAKVKRGVVMYELDKFEENFIKGEGEVFFRDKVPVPKMFLPMLLMGALSFFAATMFMLGPVKGAVIGALGALVAIFGNLALLGYRLIVSEAGVQAYVGVRSRTFRFDQIERMEVVEVGMLTYPLGRGILRRGKGGIGYVPDMGTLRGVRVHLKNQKQHVFFASNRPEQLMQAIQEGMARARGEEVQQGEGIDVVLGLDAQEDVALEHDVELGEVASSSRRG